MKTRKFCILTTARYGSNALVSLLRLSPNTICHGELFNKSGIWTAAQPGLNLPHSVEARDADPVGFLHDIEQETFKHARMFGFKLFLTHSKTVRAHVISSGDYKIILLSRPNRLAQFASLAAAQQAGIWHTRRTGSQESTPAVLFDKEEFIAYRDRLDGRYEMVKAELAATGQPYFPLEYQNIKSAPTIRALADFLGMNDESALVFQIDRIPNVRQGRPVVVDRFSNSDDVVAAMRGLGSESWLKGESPTNDV